MHFIFQENREFGKLVVKLKCLLERGLTLSAEQEVANSTPRRVLVLTIVPFPEGDVQTTLTLTKCFGSSNRGLENQQIWITTYILLKPRAYLFAWATLFHLSDYKLPDRAKIKEKWSSCTPLWLQMRGFTSFISKSHNF